MQVVVERLAHFDQIKEKMMNIESRPVVYFPTMTDEELVAYAESYSATNLEKELSVRLKTFLEEKDDVV